MSFIKRASILAAVVLSVGLPSHANLLSNGSFESGNFVPDASDTMSLGVGATDMTGWTVQNAALAWIGPSNPFSLTASDGGYFLDLSGYHDNAPYGGVSLSQNIATTVGTQYRLSFDIGTSPAYDTAAVSVQVTAGVGSSTFTSIPLLVNQWESFLFDFTATSASTAISLVGQAATNEKYIGLDNVSLTVIPEPSTSNAACWTRLGGLCCVAPPPEKLKSARSPNFFTAGAATSCACFLPAHHVVARQIWRLALREYHFLLPFVENRDRLLQANAAPQPIEMTTDL